jgi:FkbM family methyltransferase
VVSRYRTWAGSLLHPESRLLPGLGARLGRHPRLAAATLDGLHRLPTRRARALAYRHVAQPLVARMEGELVVRAAGGVRVLADPPDPSGRAIAAAGLWEWNVGAVIEQLLRPGDVFVDVGANAGYYTALAARIVGREGHVYALEPGAESFAKLQRNVALNGFDDHVTAIEAAAGAADGTATLYGPAAGHDATSSLRRPDAGARGTEVPVRPLHAVVAPEHRRRLRLVKIDVEGHEDDVLRGLEPLLDAGSMPAIVVEVHEAYNPDARAAVVDFCERHELAARWIAEDRADLDAELAPADRPLVLDELGSPPDLAGIGRDRYALLLERR